MRSVCICVALMTLASAASAQLVVIHDPTKTAPEVKMTAAEQAIFDEEAVPRVKKVVSKEMCEPNIEVTGVAHGSFSRAGAKQTLIFYQYCQTGNGFGEAGLVLIEGGKVVGNFIADAGWTMGIERVPDIDRNGLDEFTLAYSGGLHQGQGGAGVDLMQFASGMPVGIGSYQSESFGETQAMTAWKLTAKRGPKPVYYRQKYFSGESENYRRVGTNAPFKLKRVDTKFEVVK